MLRTAVIILLFFCPATAQTHQHGSSASGDGNFNPFLAADNRGGFYLAYVERVNGVSNVMLRHSKDGKTFSDPVRVNDKDGDGVVRNENPPKVVVSPGGDVYVCWANERARWKGDIRFARSVDKGKTFSPAITLNSDAGGEPVGHAFQSLAVDKRGRIYVAWIDERNKRPQDRGAEIWMSASEDGGKTFSPDRKILSDVCECCRSNMQIDAAGRLYLAYRTVPANGPMYRDIVVAKSYDRGKSFSATIVSHDGWDVNACPVSGPALCVDGSGRLTVIWFTGGGARPGLYYASSTDQSKSYSSRRLLDPDQQLGKRAQAIARRDGKIFVAWDDHRAKPVVVWGVIDPGKGTLQKSSTREGASYPTVSANDRVAVVAGVQSEPREIFLQTESLKEAAASARHWRGDARPALRPASF